MNSKDFRVLASGKYYKLISMNDEGEKYQVVDIDANRADRSMGFMDNLNKAEGRLMQMDPGPINWYYKYDKLNRMKFIRDSQMEKEQKEQETITIPEEVQIPGTGVILEKGDKIKIEEVSSFKTAIKQFVGPTDRREDAGYMIASNILEVVANMTEMVEYEEFMRGMVKAIDRELESI